MVYDGQMKLGAGNVGTVLDGQQAVEAGLIDRLGGLGNTPVPAAVAAAGKGYGVFAGWVCPAKRGQMPCGIWWINGWRVSVEKMLKERLARAVVGN